MPPTSSPDERIPKAESPVARDGDAPPPPPPMIELRGVSKTYRPRASASFPAPSGSAADSESFILDGLDWRLDEGDVALVRGESGSGKTTLLNLVAGLDRPTAGEVRVRGQRIDTLDEERLALFRRRTLGIVFQSYHLEARHTAAENVALPLLLDDVASSEAEDTARRTLESLGLGKYADAPVSRLSGGQCQRVVLARALVRRPPLLLADEPTANLDVETARMIFEELERYQRETGATLVLVTHDPLGLDRPDWRRFLCRDGRLVSDSGAPTAGADGDSPSQEGVNRLRMKTPVPK